MILAVPAAAQSSTDSAVESAEDAFGISTGREEIGVYDGGNVRGFSPSSAGNIRMEGLYFDIQGGLSSRVTVGEMIRVGPAAQGYAFPAPTGIVDLSLKKAGDNLTVSPFVEFDSFGSIEVEVDAQIPLAGPQLSLAAGAAVYDSQYANGGQSHGYTIGAVPRWRPAKGIEMLGFVHRRALYGETAQPLFQASGNFVPQGVKRATFLGPDFARVDSSNDVFGTLGHAILGDWTVRAGLFRSAYQQGVGYSNLITVKPGGDSDRAVYASPDSGSSSWSGEVRVSRRFRDGPRQHLITAALRGRSVDATYGGGDFAVLGSAPLNAELRAPQPAFKFGPQTDDQTRQLTGGIAYSMAWKGVMDLTIGVQRTRYVKRVTTPGIPFARGEDTATLPSFSLAVPLRKTLLLYGSYVRGLEDAGTAPGYAANANAVLPAIRTRQYDFGLRWSPLKDTTLILGGFDIEKPYIDLDSANRFGVLGAQRHRGVEISLTSTLASGLRLVTGAVWLDPKVTASPSIAQPVGLRPVNQPRLKSRTNLNWTLPGQTALSLDAYVNHDAGSFATVDNSLRVDPSTRFGFGARYKFALGGKPITARISFFNVGNAYAIIPVGAGVYSYNTPRNVQFYLAADF